MLNNTPFWVGHSTSMIGHYYYQSISSSELQQVINELNDNYMSHSSIKKVYDCLNGFYRYVCARDKIDNPMLLVVMPTTNNINAETKIIEFFVEQYTIFGGSFNYKVSNTKPCKPHASVKFYSD